MNTSRALAYIKTGTPQKGCNVFAPIGSTNKELSHSKFSARAFMVDSSRDFVFGLEYLRTNEGGHDGQLRLYLLGSS
jgi:hypothetical protein